MFLRDLYEAAEVDGASRWQRLWLIIIPSTASPGLQPRCHAPVDFDFAHLQPGLCHDQRRPGIVLVLGNFLYVRRSNSASEVRLRVGRRHASVRDDRRDHGRPSPDRQGAIANGCLSVSADQSAPPAIRPAHWHASDLDRWNRDRDHVGDALRLDAVDLPEIRRRRHDCRRGMAAPAHHVRQLRGNVYGLPGSALVPQQCHCLGHQHRLEHHLRRHGGIRAGADALSGTRCALLSLSSLPLWCPPR